MILENDNLNIEFFNTVFPQWGITPKITRKPEITLSALKQSEESQTPYSILILNEKLLSDGFFETLDTRAIHLPKHTILLDSTKNSSLAAKIFPDGDVKNFLVPLKESQVYTTLLHSFGEHTVDTNAYASSEIIPFEQAKEVHILVVDDNLISQQVSVKILQKMGFQVHGANDGKEALEAMGLIHFDLVFMDCQMPEMDGFETTRQLRQDENKKNLPVIALTANAMKDDRDECFAAGMNDFVTKPITAQSLTGILRKYMPIVLANKQKS